MSSSPPDAVSAVLTRGRLGTSAVVFFVVAGPEVERANRYIDEVSEGF